MKCLDESDLDFVHGGVLPTALDSLLSPRLAQIDAGSYHADPSSRLGAYEATRGYPAGTVGYAVHESIGDIYRVLGDIGQEQIGTVFNSDAARSLYAQPVDSPASLQMAQLEHSYWSQVLANDPTSIGGVMGTSVPPGARDWIQRNLETPTPQSANGSGLQTSGAPFDMFTMAHDVRASGGQSEGLTNIDAEAE